MRRREAERVLLCSGQGERVSPTSGPTWLDLPDLVRHCLEFDSPTGIEPAPTGDQLRLAEPLPKRRVDISACGILYRRTPERLPGLMISVAALCG